MVVASSATRRRGGDKNIMWHTYILQSIKNSRLYVGFTDDIQRRLLEHNSGTGGNYTSNNKPFKLIFYESFISKKDATNQEMFYKTGYGREVLKKKLYNYFNNQQ